MSVRIIVIDNNGVVASNLSPAFNTWNNGPVSIKFYLFLYSAYEFAADDTLMNKVLPLT